MTCNPPATGSTSLARSFYSRKDHEDPLIKIGSAAGLTTATSIGYCIAREMAHPNGLAGPFAAAAARSVRTMVIAAAAGSAFGAGVFMSSAMLHHEATDHWSNHFIGGALAGAIWSLDRRVRARRVIGFAIFSGALFGGIKHALQTPINWLGVGSDPSVKVIGARLINAGAQPRVLMRDPLYKVDESPLLADLSIADSRRNVHKSN